MITLKRAYDRISRTDGTRFLVERLWPRGVSKAKLKVDGWLNEVGPSTELRRWFGHDPEKWGEFRRRYFVSSTPDRRRGSRSCQLLGGAESRLSTVHTIRSTTMRSPCNSTCKRSRGGPRRPSEQSPRTGTGDPCAEST
jgi:uncharacterized protein YeaO (DUF488 family)